MFCSVIREIFINPETNELYKIGDVMKRPRLAETLRRIALFGVDEFYRGETAKKMIEDLQAYGGIMTLEDLASYRQASSGPKSRSCESHPSIHEQEVFCVLSPCPIHS
jgi:gamma-glutamyltranspeptidase